VTDAQPKRREVEIPRPHLDARTTAWFLEQRARTKELELRAARLEGVLETSARVERGAQRFCDRLEEQVAEARQREATLARALGYAEAERDQLAKQLEVGETRAAARLERPKRRRLFGRR